MKCHPDLANPPRNGTWNFYVI